MSTVSSEELDKFSKLKSEWWDPNGSLKTLHDINETRISFITNHVDLGNKIVMDMGCGGGILTESLANASPLKITGIDLEPNAIEVAKKHAQSSQLKIEYLNESIEDHPLERQYDVITCLEMLEHVPVPELLLNKLCMHLKPGGSLFLSTINRTAKAYLYTILGAEYLLKIIPKYTHDYNKYIKPRELDQVLRKNGLRLIDIQGLYYNPLLRSSGLSSDIEVNYLMSAIKDL